MSAKSTSTTTVMRMKMRSRSSAPGAGTPRRIDTKLEEFLAQQFGGPDLVDFYDSESCVQDNHDKTLLGKFKFKVLIVCRDRVYICDNPPKDLSSFIMFDDIAEIKIVDDIPKFLNGAEKENATHICLKCYRSEKSEKRRQEMTELKRRMLELKRSMIYSRAIDNKLNEIELSTPRTYKNMCSAYMENEGVDLTHRSNTTLEHLAALNTNREGIEDDSAALQATNRTNKSIRFDPGLDENKEEIKIEPPKRETDAVTELAVKARYSRLVELANKNKSVSKSGDPLSLSLPLTPRSLNGYPIDTTIEGDKISERNAKELELIENRINFDFINGSQADISMVHVYVLNPKTTVIQTLRNALFLSKILATLNYHQTFEEEIKAELLQRSVKLRNFEKKTKQLMEEIRNNQGNPERLSDLFDELMLATHTHYIIKKMFWSIPDFYKLTVNEITRFLPKSPARMDLGAVSVDRRNKELECSIAMIEAISMMLSETEFYGSRNEFLQEEKCRYLRFLFKSLITKPEVAKLDDQFYNDQIYGLGRKAKSIMSSLIIVKGLLLWEICHFLSLSSWNNSSDFNLNICLKEFDNISFIEWYIPQLIDELAKIINDNTQVVLTPKQTIIVFKLFSLLATIIEKSNLTSSNLIKFLRSNHCEEFKYYFNPDRVKLKTFNYYPIINDLIEVVRKLNSYVVET